MKKNWLLTILFLGQAPFLLQASLINTERVIKITSSHLAGFDLSTSEKATDRLFSILLNHNATNPQTLESLNKALEEVADPNARLLYHYSYTPVRVLWMTPSMIAAKINSPATLEILKILATAGADHNLCAIVPFSEAPTEVTSLFLAKSSQNVAVQKYLCAYSHAERGER